MKFCQEHWDKLRNGLIEAGLGSFIPTSGKALFERLKKEDNGQATIPDPLFTCHNMILERALGVLGPYIMMKPENGEDGYCPICEANKNCVPHPQTNRQAGESWIETIIPYMKSEFEREGWIKPN